MTFGRRVGFEERGKSGRVAMQMVENRTCKKLVDTSSRRIDGIRRAKRPGKSGANHKFTSARLDELVAKIAIRCAAIVV